MSATCNDRRRLRENLSQRFSYDIVGRLVFTHRLRGGVFYGVGHLGYGGREVVRS